MSKSTKRIVLAILSFIIWPVGIVLFFMAKPKKDAQLFGILGLLGLIFSGGYFFF